jgi:hypothetical protein
MQVEVHSMGMQADLESIHSVNSKDQKVLDDKNKIMNKLALSLK